MGPINHDRTRVGIVQHYLRHKITFGDEGAEDGVKQVEHVLACVKWKQFHPQLDRFGISATVCVDMFELPGACSIIPVQRIAYRCAHAVLPINFGEFTETVFVACSVPSKHSM